MYRDYPNYKAVAGDSRRGSSGSDGHMRKRFEKGTHDGRIRIESEQGKGTTVCFSLPIAPAG